MKIICESCGAKYSISDDKVQGKVFKIRCKKCSEVIVVKGTDTDVEGGGDYGSAYGNTGGAAEWYVVIDGERVGPITPEEVEAYFTAGRLHGETYVWRDGLDDWVMLHTLSEFAHLVQESAGPQEATMVATRSSAAEVAYQGEPAYAAAGGGEYSGGDYGGNYDDHYSGATDTGDSTMVMDSGRFEAQGFDQLGSGQSGASAAVESGSYGAVDSGGYDDTNTLEVNQAGISDSGYDSGGYGDGGYDSGGYDDGGGGMFAAFDSSASDYADQDFGQDAQAAPDLSASSAEPDDNLVGARNENSVLFSLSSVDQVKAVSAAPAGGAGQAQGSDKSGLIDIQALASTHAAMSGKGGAKSGDDDFVAGTMSMPALMPMGSKKSNTGLVVGISVAAAVLVVGLVGVIAYLVLSGSEDPGAVAQPQGLAVVAEQSEEEEDELTSEEAAEAEAAAAAAQAALEGKEAAEEEEQAEAEEEEEEEKEAVAQRPSRSSSTASTRSTKRSEPARSAKAPSRPASGSGVDSIIGQIDQGGGGSAGSGGSGGSQPAARNDLPDSLSRAMVQRAIRRYNAQVSSCGTNSNPDDLTGTAMVRFVVEGNGSVSSAQIQGEFRGTQVGSCIEGVVRGIRFPETRDNSRTINYPFRVR